MTTGLRGLFTPITTPFAEDGEVALDRLAEQLHIYESFDLAGVVVFGTSGEGPLLDAAEEAPILAVVRDVVSEDRRILVQVGRESVRASVAAAARAEEAGADALLCLPPRFFATGAAVIESHYRAIASGTALPLLAYHIPHLSKVDLTADFLVSMAADGVIDGIKDSAGDLALEDVLRRVAGSDFTILCGKASVTADALEQGADGAILAIADAAPEPVLALLAAHAAGDPARVRALQASLDPLGEACGPRFGIAGIKAALDLRGWPGGGDPRAPLQPLTNGERVLVAEALRTAGVAI